MLFGPFGRSNLTEMWDQKVYCSLMFCLQVDLNNWLLVCTDKDVPRAQQFAKELEKVCHHMDIRVGYPNVKTLPNDRSETYLRAIRDNLTREVRSLCVVWHLEMSLVQNPPTRTQEIQKLSKRRFS